MAYKATEPDNANAKSLSVDLSKYKTPILIIIIEVIAIIGIIIGLIGGIIFIIKNDSPNRITYIISGFALAVSSLFIVIMCRVADNINYLAFINTEQAIDNRTTISYYDTSIELLTQQRDALDEIVEKQNQIIESLKKKTS